METACFVLDYIVIAIHVRARLRPELCAEPRTCSQHRCRHQQKPWQDSIENPGWGQKQ